MLTPRSKIKALLATVDSSDEEGGVPTNLKSAISGSSVQSALKQLDSDNNEDDSESDVEIRPRGRLAARMQANSTSPKEKGLQTARERVKQMLARGEEQQGAQHEGEDDDDDLPVAPRRLHRRPACEATPKGESSQRKSNPSSPGLFVSSPAKPLPSRSGRSSASDSDSDALPAVRSDRFKALVEKKRQERLAREAREEAERVERRARQEKLSSELGGIDDDDDDVSNISDDEGGQTLTQKSVRPARKASKKAIEEMNRETQRMARSMQLAHEAKTRKKITKSSLFDRFNFKPNDETAVPLPQPTSSSRPNTPQSDAEMADEDTPPSSPPSASKSVEVTATIQTAEDEEDLPSLNDIVSAAAAEALDKGKEKTTEIPEDKPTETDKTTKRVRVRLPNMLKTLAGGSDDELEITATVQDKVKAVFDNVPVKAAQESHSLQVLRALALVQSPDRNQNRRGKKQPGMTNNELQASLQQRARQQAKSERMRRLDLLKSQGIVVQTMEERERQMEEVEDIVAKAREKVQLLMEQEREAAKKEKKDSTSADPLDWDDSDDEFVAPEEEVVEDAEAIQLSGSEDEGEDADDESDTANPIFDDEAEESEAEQEITEVSEDEKMEGVVMQTRRRRARNITAVLSDDEADMEIKATPKPVKKVDQISPAAQNNHSPAAPGSVLRSAKKSFIPGLPVKGPAGLGLTQIFAGTMDDSQMGTANSLAQSMMPDFDQFPDSNFSATMDPLVDGIVEDSQRPETQGVRQGVTQGIRLNMSQSQMHGLDSLMRDSYPGESQTIEFSQDGGFQAYTPLKDRFIEPPFSTVATDVAGPMEDDGTQASPLLRRGKLRRKADMETAIENTQPTAAEAPAQDAFARLRHEAQRKEKRRPTDAFNAKTSKAKEMVEREAQESDDEYAGLGGADGEDSDNESNASVQEMIDDATANNADDSKLAAFYA